MGGCCANAAQVVNATNPGGDNPPSPVPIEPDSESDAPIPDKISELTIAIFGLDNAGKSCFLRSLCGDFNFDTVASVGLVEETFMHDDTIVKIYDLGGGATFRSVWARWYAEIWGFIYLVDSSDPNRFAESKTVLHDVIVHPMMKYKPFIVVANKQDKEGSVLGSEVLKELGLVLESPVFEVSVITTDGENCHRGVQQAVSALLTEVIRLWPKIAKRRNRNVQEQERINEEEHQAKQERIRKRRE
jgi:small GTP-binding protein